MKDPLEIKEAVRETVEALKTTISKELCDRIRKSTHTSSYTADQAIYVSTIDYSELAIVNGELTLIDYDGNQFNLFRNLSLTEIIDLM